MSTDRTTEILNYLTAISRDIGEMRDEIKQINKRLEQIEMRVEQMDGRLVRMERDQRQQIQRLDRIAGAVLTMRADVEELQDRVVELESKQA